MNHHAVAIIGAGFAGLGTAISLQRAGRLDFVVLERGDDVGGTWRDNTYPGCACDVPSHVYSFSFAPNPNWTRAFSPQPEILDYLRRTAREAGVLDRIHFGTELLEATWVPERQHWHLRTSTGELTADVVVAGTGPLSSPSTPSLPGLSTFEGTTFHSAQWDHSWSSAGRRVAVIGTGASAIQFVPHLAKDVAHLSLFQRTAPWVLPRWDREIPTWLRSAYAKVPGLQKAARTATYWNRESHIIGFRYQHGVLRWASKQAAKNIERQVSDPVKREKLTPTFTMGCKRVLLSNTYYRALDQDNADVVTDRIVEVVPTGVVTEAADGTRTTHEVDTIVFGTGFQVTDPPVAHRVSAGGQTLAEHWKGTGMQALHGMAVAGFPNFFILVGPNTGLGHNSIVLMVEAQVGHLLKALDAMDAGGYASIEPRQDVQDAYNAKLQKSLARTVWNRGGCKSWYLDSEGRNTTLWPTFTFTFMRELAAFDLSEYVVEKRLPDREAVPAA